MDANDELIEAHRRIIDRLTRAGWIERSIISKSKIEVRFTPAGLEALEKLGGFFYRVGWLPESQAEAITLASLLGQADEQRMSESAKQPPPEDDGGKSDRRA